MSIRLKITNDIWKKKIKQILNNKKNKKKKFINNVKINIIIIYKMNYKITLGKLID